MKLSNCGNIPQANAQKCQLKVDIGIDKTIKNSHVSWILHDGPINKTPPTIFFILSLPRYPRRVCKTRFFRGGSRVEYRNEFIIYIRRENITMGNKTAFNISNVTGRNAAHAEFYLSELV